MPAAPPVMEATLSSKPMALLVALQDVSGRSAAVEKDPGIRPTTGAGVTKDESPHLGGHPPPVTHRFDDQSTVRNGRCPAIGIQVGAGAKTALDGHRRAEEEELVDVQAALCQQLGGR
ncbi:MAG: hypothetical protein QOG99_2222, partial [Frankiales bacterium]|nr:hypothetical protein [Frankiales bacterium]